MASPFDSNALTLGEYAVTSNDPLVKKITYSLHKTLNVVQDIPLLDRQTLTQNGVRFVGNLPGVNWVPLNTPGTVTRGKPTPYQEQMYLVRNQFQVDKKFIGEENAISNPLDVQIGAWLEAFAYDFNTKFINNAHDGAAGHDNNAIVGIRARLDSASQFGNVAEMKMSAGGLDLSSANITSANANTFLEQLEQVLDFMNAPDGEDVVFYMNDFMKRKMNRAIRTAGPGAGFETSMDSFDRAVSKYKDATIRDVGRRVDQATRVILPTEDVNGNDGGTVYTSIYAVKYGEDSFCGWQWEALKPVNLGLDPTNGVAYNSVIDWGVGLYQAHTRSIGRLYGIKIA